MVEVPAEGKKGSEKGWLSPGVCEDVAAGGVDAEVVGLGGVDGAELGVAGAVIDRLPKMNWTGTVHLDVCRRAIATARQPEQIIVELVSCYMARVEEARSVAGMSGCAQALVDECRDAGRVGGDE